MAGKTWETVLTADSQPTTPIASKPAPARLNFRASAVDHKQAADGRLDDLVAKMNAAPGMEKAAATAAVVNEMVAQRRTMRDGMKH